MSSRVTALATSCEAPGGCEDDIRWHRGGTPWNERLVSGGGGYHFYSDVVVLLAALVQSGEGLQARRGADMTCRKQRAVFPLWLCFPSLFFLMLSQS